jgi:TolA-binding protein
MTLVRCACLFFACLSFAACITPSEKKSMKDDIFNVQTRLLNLERLLTDTSKEGKSNADAATKRIASTQSELEHINQELRQLHGDVDALRVGVTTGQMPGTDPNQQTNSIAGQVAKLGERLDAIEQAQEELLQAIRKAGIKKADKKKDSRNPAASIAELQQAFDEKRYKQVVDDGQRLIKDGNAADREEARFLVAESYFKQGKMREAALKFGDFLDNKPANKKNVPAAKMHMGDAFRQLGDPQTARVYYEELVKEFPGTAEADSAKARLAETASANSKG